MIHSCNNTDDSVSFSKTGFSTGISGFSTLSKTGFSDDVTEISAPPSLFDSVVVVVVELLRLWSWFLLVFVTLIYNKQVVTYLTYNGTQSFMATLTYLLAQKPWILLLFFYWFPNQRWLNFSTDKIILIYRRVNFVYHQWDVYKFILFLKIPVKS